METVINSSEIDVSFIEKIKQLYLNKKVKITIEEVKSFEEMTGKEQWKEIQEMRKKHPPFHISKDIDISRLANQVNDMDL